MLSGNSSRIKYWGNYVEAIQLSSNSLSGTLPNETSQFLRLTSLKVSNNSLEGILPPVLGTFPELKEIDLSLNRLSGFLLPSLFASTKLTTLNLSNNNFSGPIPLQLPNSPLVSSKKFSLMSLDLSNNNLNGILSPKIKELHNLEYLNICNNKLEGAIPNDLPDDLRGFNVSLNNFSGVVPDKLSQFPESAFHPGNPKLIFPNSPLSPKDSSNSILGLRSHKKVFTRSVLITCLVTGAFVMAIMAATIFYRICRKKEMASKQDAAASDIVPESTSPSKRRNLESLPHSQSDDTENIHPTVKKPKNEEGTSSPVSIISASNPSPSTSRQFENPSSLNVSSPDKLVGDLHLFDGSLMLTAEELSCAPAEVIGRSCHGTLYKATLESGHVLAVKWLREGITKGKKELAREIKKLGTIKHPSLVSFLGCYLGPKEHERLIISNFMNAYSLDIYLHGKIMASYFEFLGLINLYVGHFKFTVSFDFFYRG